MCLIKTLMASRLAASLSLLQAQTSTSAPNPFQFSLRLLPVFLPRLALVAAAPDGRALSCTLSVLPGNTRDAGLMVLWARTMACARVTESTRMVVWSMRWCVVGACLASDAGVDHRRLIASRAGSYRVRIVSAAGA